MKVLILGTEDGDWEALYINGSLVMQGHEITRMDLLEASEAHGFTRKDIHFATLNTKDNDWANDYGWFKEKLDEWSGTYET